MSRHVVAAFLGAFLLFASADSFVRADGAQYTVEDLGTIDGLVPTITGMNASGQVSGYVNAAAGPRAVRFTDGLGWAYVPGLQSVYSTAMAINASGDLAGYAMTASGLRAYRYVDGPGVTFIPALPGGSFAVGLAINAGGDVVGYGNSSSGTRGWRASPGLAPVVLPTLGGSFSMTCGINDAGQIAGSSSTAAGYQHGYRIESNGVTVTDFGTFNGPTGTGVACAIDASGRVGGRATAGSVFHAFTFAAGPLQDLDTFGSQFSTVDAVAEGVSVGYYIRSTDSTQRAFVHTDADGSSDLNDRIPAGSGWVLVDATAVNAGGRIAGQGVFGGNPRAFRLTPAPSAPVDTTAPTITSVSATPSSVTPPDKTMVAVAISAVATDDHDPSPVCTVSAIDGHGAPAADYSITGPLAGSVRATGGATYSFTVSCSDAAGNAATSSVDVVVPPDTAPPVFTSLTATPSTIWPPKGQTVTVTTAATATDNSGETPVCTLSSITGPGSSTADAGVTGANTGTVKAVGGRTYVFHESCVDGSGNAASSTVDVTVPADVTAPVISALTATPSSVPPTYAMVPVTLTVTATDEVDDAPSCALSGITAPGAGPDDFSISGPLSASVRAVGGRTYSLTVTCSDAATNSATRSVDVVVPPDTTAPTIGALSVSPNAFWPPNNKMVEVTWSVSATDDVDASPTCSLASISGGTPADSAITGSFTANVRAVNGVVYTLHVSCQDRAGNKADADVTVSVSKDAGASSGKKK